MDNREAAIEWFSMLKEKFVKTEYEGYLDMAIAALEQREKDRWIPVAENPKKPKYQFDTYLVYTKYGRFGVAEFFMDGRWIGYDIDGDQIDGDEITAWCRLPEVFKGE